jgi:hypothetical protein
MGGDRHRLSTPLKRQPPVAQAALAVRASTQCDHISDKADTSRSMSASLCSGDGVKRRRSVPSGTVG